jgi:hypothetical protein
MRTNSINNKVNKNMTKSIKNLANLLREDCKKLVEVSETKRDEEGNLLTYNDISKKKEFFCAYKKAQLHFNQLVKAGPEGDRIAHVVFGKNAHECVKFRIVEESYLKDHPEDGGFFNADKFYDFCRKTSPEEKLQNKIAAKNAKFEAERVKAVRETGRRNRTIIAIVILVLITVAAIAVAMYKKGVKPVIKAIAFGACCVTVILAFRKAQDAVLDRIKNKFYGNK